MGPWSSLGLSSALALGLLAGRVAHTGSLTFAFLAWNLFLAWIPFVAARALHGLDARGRLAWPAALGLGAVWLAFLPNAPYIVTDLLHLRPRPAAPMWFDAVLLFSFAWTGALLGLSSLATVQRLVAARTSRAFAWGFALSAALLSGVGIYLGRFIRFNSWDLVTRPLSVLGTTARVLIDPTAIATSLLFGAIVAAAYVGFRSARAS